MALVALLTAVYQLSRRKAVDLLSDMVGVRISVGAHQHRGSSRERRRAACRRVAWDCVRELDVNHTDGAS